MFQTEDSYVQSNIIDPAIKGTLNLLKSCLKAKSVKRVVFTSSISTLTAKDRDGKWRPVVDEFCQTPIDHVWNTKASGWVMLLLPLSCISALKILTQHTPKQGLSQDFLVGWANLDT